MSEMLLQQLKPRMVLQRSSEHDWRSDPLLIGQDHFEDFVMDAEGMLSPGGRVRQTGKCFLASNGQELKNVSIAYFATGENTMVMAARSAASAMEVMPRGGLETMLVTDDTGLRECSFLGAFDIVLSVGSVFASNSSVTRFAANSPVSEDSILERSMSGTKRDTHHGLIAALHAAKILAVKIAIESASHTVIIFLDVHTHVCRSLLYAASVLHKHVI